MDTSKFLGKVIGMYLVIISIVMLINREQFTFYIYKVIKNAP
jgi:hypothetical protein